MLQKILILSLLQGILSEFLGPAVDRTVSDGVKSSGYSYQVIYGDRDITLFNEVVTDAEKSRLNAKENQGFDSIPPLPPHDVKCFMTADRFCSPKMKITKGVLIQAIKDDCKKCSVKQKEEAGKIISAFLIHDPVAWKVFLTRTALQFTPNENSEFQEFDYRRVGEGQDIHNAKNRYTKKGVKVRVRRYAAEIITKS